MVCNLQKELLNICVNSKVSDETVQIWAFTAGTWKQYEPIGSEEPFGGMLLFSILRMAE